MVEIDGSVAVLEYEMSSANSQSVIHLVSTKVPDTLAGKGVGSLLAEAAFSHSRQNQLRVKNSCWFLDKYLDKNPQFKTLLV